MPSRNSLFERESRYIVCIQNVIRVASAVRYKFIPRHKCLVFSLLHIESVLGIILSTGQTLSYNKHGLYSFILCRHILVAFISDNDSVAVCKIAYFGKNLFGKAHTLTCSVGKIKLKSHTVTCLLDRICFRHHNRLCGPSIRQRIEVPIYRQPIYKDRLSAVNYRFAVRGFISVKHTAELYC